MKVKRDMWDARALRSRRVPALLLALFTLVLFAACTATPTSETSRMRYLALGDSYTIGEGVDKSDRWPMQLARALRADGLAVDDPRIIATTGWTTDELSSAMDAAEPLGGWDFVSLLIGVNNQYRERPAGQYRAEFEALLKRSVALARGRADRVVVVSIPDWGVTPFGASDAREEAAIGREIDAYNAAAREVAASYKVAFVDITPMSRAHGGEAPMLAADGLHPSGAMYTLWNARVHPVARALLQRR